MITKHSDITPSHIKYLKQTMQWLNDWFCVYEMQKWYLSTSMQC